MKTDIRQMQAEELSNLKKEVLAREAELEQQRIEEAQREIGERLEVMRQHKDMLLALSDHSRTSCSDENPCNGYGTASYGARCPKCHLIEILNGEWGNRFDVRLSFEIFDSAR